MRPLKLRIEGLRSFRSEVEIDFADRSHVAVVGDTGAGKSSILEAITYALYGKTSFGRQADLMNDTSKKLRVVLRFRVSGDEWEVVRTLRRNRKDQVGQAGAQLQCMDKDGKPLEQVEQVRLVNERVEQLIGLDSDAFLRTVVLPQGRFARLLAEDTPSERSEVLRQVWPTDDLEAVGEWAFRALGKVRQTRAQLEQEADGRPEDPKAHLEKLTASAEAAEGRAKEASALAQEASQALTAMREAAERARTAETQRSRLKPGLAQIEDAEAQVAPVEEIERRLDKEEREIKQKQADVRDQLNNLPSDDDGPGRNDVAEALAKLGNFPELAGAATEAARDMRDKKAEAASQGEAAAQAKATAANAKEEKERHAQLRPPLAKAKEAAETRRRDAERAHERCSRLHQSATDAQAKATRLAEERTQRAAEAEAAHAEHEKAKKDAAAADTQLARARRASSAAAAAHGLHPGDDCPVCRRDLPQDWKPPPDEGLAEAEDAARTATDEDQAAAKRVAGARARLQGVDDQLAVARSEAERASQEYQAAAAEIVARFGDGADAAALDALLGPLDEHVRESADDLARYDEAHEVLADRLEQRSTEVAAAVAEASGAQQLAKAAHSAAVGALNRLNRNVVETPSPYRPSVDLPGDPAELHEIDASVTVDLVAQAKERQTVLGQREAQRKKFRQELEQATRDREALVQRRVAQVEQPLAAVAQALDPHRDAVLRAKDALSSPADAPATDALSAIAVPPSAPDAKNAAALQQWMQALRDATSTLIQVAADLAERAGSDAQAARDRLGEVGLRLAAQHAVQQRSEDSEDEETAPDHARTADLATPPEAPEPPTDPETVVAAANQAHDDLRLHARDADRTRDAFAAVIDDVQTLRALLLEAEELERALDDLDKAFKPAAFLKWLTLRRSRSLLVHASGKLREISGDKYAFADPDDDEVQWSVLDKESGQPRSPASLSGGEQFIASLALALGMVEMMARSGGRLESLFLDEGFGSLDRDNLDAAVQALGTVAAQGRMVGVISHVRAVAEQIDHVLAVTRTAAGSRAEWLSEAERNRLSVSDAGSEVASAMQGLLE